LGRGWERWSGAPVKVAPTDLDQCNSEVREALSPQIGLPLAFHPLHGCADASDGGLPAFGEVNNTSAPVRGIPAPHQVTLGLQLTHEIVDRLPADARPARELRNPDASGRRVLQDHEVRRTDALEPFCLQVALDSVPHRLPARAEQRPDQRSLCVFR
jgi:hypothetical protein